MVANKEMNSEEKKKMLDRVNELSWGVVEMTEYLDTHPYEKDAIDYFVRLNREYNKAKKAYYEAFGPLTIDQIDQVNDMTAWNWALEDLPWR